MMSSATAGGRWSPPPKLKSDKSNGRLSPAPNYSSLDYSFMGLTQVTSILTVMSADEEGRERRQGSPTRAPSATVLKLNNNEITDIGELHSTLIEMDTINPDRVTWIDLSCNKITDIEEHFSKMPNLQVVYLHGNRIAHLSQIVRLGELLPKLRSLTLHGNAIEEKKGYRNFVVSAIPSLVKLDFSMITRQDREDAGGWASMNQRIVKRMARE